MRLVSQFCPVFGLCARRYADAGPRFQDGRYVRAIDALRATPASATIPARAVVIPLSQNRAYAAVARHFQKSQCWKGPEAGEMHEAAAAVGANLESQ